MHLFASQKMDKKKLKKIISHIRFAASDYIPSHQFLSNLLKKTCLNCKFKSKKPERIY